MWRPPLLPLLGAAASCLPAAAAVCRGSLLRQGVEPPRAPGAGAAVQRVGAVAQPRAKVYYLFLVADQVLHLDIWKRFFASGKPGDEYEAFVHCSAGEDACRRNMDGRTFRAVETVRSRYCNDLVSPMLQLLSAAVNRSTGNPRDKYVFLSENSLPVKPFAEAQRTLTEGQEGTASFSYVDWCGGVKASQWSVLSYAHAVRLLRNHSTTNIQKAFWLFRSFGPPVYPKYWQMWWGWSRCGGCLDEMLPFAAIFGLNQTYKLTDRDPLRASLRNRTYMWTYWTDKFSEKMQLAQTGAAASRLSGASRLKGPYGPAVVTLLSAGALRKFRGSEFLFMRKVTPWTRYAGNLSLSEAFEEFVFRGQ